MDGTRPSDPSLRPWSATAGTSRGGPNLISTHLSSESIDDSPRSAWGEYGRRSITPVNLPTYAHLERPDSAPIRIGEASSSTTTRTPRTPTPVDPETGLKIYDPALPLIRAIKDELNRFKSSVNTDSSTA